MVLLDEEPEAVEQRDELSVTDGEAVNEEVRDITDGVRETLRLVVNVTLLQTVRVGLNVPEDERHKVDVSQLEKLGVDERHCVMVPEAVRHKVGDALGEKVWDSDKNTETDPVTDGRDENEDPTPDIYSIKNSAVHLTIRGAIFQISAINCEQMGKNQKNL